MPTKLSRQIVATVLAQIDIRGNAEEVEGAVVNVDTLLATVRAEEREAAFKDAAVIASDFRRLDQDTLWARYKTLTLETALLGAIEK